MHWIPSEKDQQLIDLVQPWLRINLETCIIDLRDDAPDDVKKGI